MNRDVLSGRGNDDVALEGDAAYPFRQVSRRGDWGAVGQPPRPHRAVAAAADDHRGASGSAPAATALTQPVWPGQRLPGRVPSASRHARTVPWPPLTITGVSSGGAPTATAFTSAVWPIADQELPSRAVGDLEETQG